MHYRTAVVLRYMVGLSPSEIATRLEISPDNARQRITRGLAKLRARLAPELRERKDLLAAFVCLAQPPALRVATATSIPHVGATAAAVIILVKKPLAILAFAALLCVGGVVLSPLDGAKPRPDVEVALDGITCDLDSRSLEDTSVATALGTRTAASSEEPTAAPTATSAPLPRALDASGDEVRGVVTAVYRLEPGRTLRLRLVDSATGDPLGTARCALFTSDFVEHGTQNVHELARRTHFRAQATESGRVVFDGVGKEPMQLYCSCSGYGSVLISYVTTGEPVELTVALSPLKDLGLITGTIDASIKCPITITAIGRFGERYSAMVSGDGTFTISDLPRDQSYRIHIQYELDGGISGAGARGLFEPDGAPISIDI